MLKKLIPGRSSRGNSSSQDNGSGNSSLDSETPEPIIIGDEAPQQNSTTTINQGHHVDTHQSNIINSNSTDSLSSLSQSNNNTSNTTVAAPSSLSDPSSVALTQSRIVASHPVTPEADYSLPASTLTTPNSTNNSRNGSPELQAHLRKVTASLIDILDQISPGSTTTSIAGSTSTPPRHAAIGSRGDSVATMVDLEANSTSAPASNEELVPAHHVRRLTTTIVDMLRSMATVQRRSSTQFQDGRDIEGIHKRHGLLADNNSDASIDDKASLSSSAAASSGKDSEMSAATALLRSQYLPQPEYRGDDVRPFYLDGCKRTCSGVPSDDGSIQSVPGSKALSSVYHEPINDDDCPIPRKMRKKRRVNWFGLLVFVLFLSAFGAYIGLRASKTLGLGGSLWYGIIVLSVEIIGGLAMLPYGLCLCMRVVDPPSPVAEAAAKGQAAMTALSYHIRVVIPCYKEPLDVISKTFMASMYAAMPSNCRRTVYLLDDGKDPEKRQFVRSLGLPNAVYISGRKRAKGEMNGKSANINNAARLIYPAGVPIPLEEVLCVFDADQVPNADFFMKTIPLLDGGQDIAMVLSPQTFYNLNPDADIFNHANVHFWDYTQPGYDALGLISCTGTNFLLRARAFQDAGLFPEWTLTEDFALGIELKKRGWQCRYVDEYLAVGEAPEEVRNCFQQRSRWAKGHFQVFFSRGHNPTIGSGSKGLSLLMKWMYGSVILSYFSAFLGTPLLMLVPIITVWFGAFPIVINFWAAVSITFYYGATMALMYYTRSLSHLKSMWFASVSNSILWFAFLKAMYRATIGRWLSGTIVFKVTAKGLQRLNKLPFRDVWMSTIWFVFSLITLIFGLVHFFKGGVLDTPLAISLIFMVYNLIPQYLLLQYAAYRPRAFYNIVCKLAMFLSTAMAIMGVVLVWVLYPKSYDYKSALGSSLYFIDSQRIGSLPPNFRVSWRHDAFTSENAATVYLATNPNASLLFGDGMNGFGSFDFYGSGSSPFGSMYGPGSSPFYSGSGGGGFGSSPFSSDPFGRRRLLQSDDSSDGDILGAAGGFDSSTSVLDPFAPTSVLSPSKSSPSSPSSSKTPSSLSSPTTASKSPSTSRTTPSPSTTTTISDPFAGSTTTSTTTTPGSSLFDPFSPSSSGSSSTGGNTISDPFDPFAPSSSGSLDQPLESYGVWDLEGGWLSGMAGGNIKATTPIAFTTTMLAWGFMSFPEGFQAAKQTQSLKDSVKWGADYLTKVYKIDEEKNTSLIVTRVGDVDTELMLWYRPEDGGVRDAYAVDLNSQYGGYGADLGGSVAAGLAAASVLFHNGQDDQDMSYSKVYLQHAQDVYEASKHAKLKFTDSDFNMTLVYNSSTVYDDLAWGAAWLYKATKDEGYLTDVYDFYIKHMEAEAEIADWKYAFDWDNVFWPLNLLLAQETGKGTFKKQTEVFLRSWMCANNAANYTQRGRAFNPMTAALGSTANTAMAALMYSNIVEDTDPIASKTYKCWALSQLRYMLGDAGRSLVVNVGKNSPKRTQDRGAACPAPPAVCNRVTGLLSPDPDEHKLTGALVQGSGLSDNFMDIRSNDAARVGVENNAGFTGALAGAVLLPDGMWEVCLQSFGIYRNNPVCGAFVAV